MDAACSIYSPLTLKEVLYQTLSMQWGSLLTRYNIPQICGARRLSTSRKNDTLHISSSRWLRRGKAERNIRQSLAINNKAEQGTIIFPGGSSLLKSLITIPKWRSRDFHQIISQFFVCYKEAEGWKNSVQRGQRVFNRPRFPILLPAHK